MPATVNKEKSARILDEVKRRKGQEKVMEVDEKKVKLVIFSLFDDYYAFSGEDIKEILPFQEITYVPGSPEIILGIINVRGQIESVLNIHRFLGLPETETTKDSCIAIAAKKGVRSGILVDSIDDVTDVPVSSIKPPVSSLDKSIQEFVIGETTCNGKNVTLLDIGKIFQRSIV